VYYIKKKNSVFEILKLEGTFEVDMDLLQRFYLLKEIIDCTFAGGITVLGSLFPVGSVGIEFIYKGFGK
jgi:hypothetical protein